MAITQSSGREPWIFRVDSPADLIGSHRELIASALEPDERVLHLIYSPAWEGTAAPFGISGRSASHSIALTPSRWIVSEDRHESWAAPRVESIPFSHVISIEKGSALLEAWMVIHYECEGALQRATILHKSIGNHHFDDAVRTYRSLDQAVVHDHGNGDDTWQHIPRYLAQELMPVLVEGERVLVSTRTSEEWEEEKRWWKHVERCTQPWSAFLITDHGLVYAEAEAPRERGLWAFGSNVWCVPPGVLRAALLIEDNTRATHQRRLRLNLALTRGSVRNDLNVRVASAEDDVVRELTHADRLEKRSTHG